MNKNHDDSGHAPRVGGGEGASAEGVSLCGPNGRRRLLTACGMGMVALWCSALALDGRRAAGQGMARTGEDGGETESAPYPEGFVVGGTSETEAFLQERGAAFARARASLRFVLRVKTGNECVRDLIAGNVHLTLIPRVLTSEELWQLARRNSRVVQIPVFASVNGFTRNFNRPGPTPDPEVFYLYARGEVLSLRPKVRAFAHLCQFGSVPVSEVG
jgi:hypothetical protein